MLTVSARLQDGVVRVDLAGRIDGGDSCRKIHDVIKQNLDQDHKRFVLNLGEVDWINSLGVGFLVAGAVSAAERGAAVGLFGVTPRVRTLLHACGVVPHIWRDFASEEEALAAFR